MGLRYTSYIETPRNYLGEKRTHFSQASNIPSLLRTTSLTRSSRQSKSKRHFVTYGCRNCRVHFSSSRQIISKHYRGRTGDAYLITNVLNVIEGKIETRSMLTGEYVVCDILCHLCKTLVGWKYLKSEHKDQRYKEGKYILELQTIRKC